MGSHMRCTKMHQNALKCTKMHQNGHHIMTEQNCLKYVLSDLYDLFSGLNGHLKGDSSQNKSSRDLGVTHEVHQNAPKWTKMVTIS